MAGLTKDPVLGINDIKEKEEEIEIDMKHKDNQSHFGYWRSCRSKSQKGICVDFKAYRSKSCTSLVSPRVQSFIEKNGKHSRSLKVIFGGEEEYEVLVETKVVVVNLKEY